MSSTYLEIRALANELNSTKVRDRRAAGEQLQQRLSRVEVRQRLAQEAAGSSQALAEMWGLILMNAIVSVQKMIGKTSTKVTATDLLLPFKLLRCCNLDDTNNNSMYQEPSSSKLSRKTTKLVFSYCYDLLHDDNALELAEVHLLEMMAYLCARKEYVAYMRPHVEMHAVVQQIEVRLTDDDDRPPMVVVTAGQIFENLLCTSKDLGVGIHLLLPGCIKMLAIWCANNRNTNRTAVGFSHIFRGLSALLSSDPEQAIAPLTRHGRPILSFAKRRYSFANGKDRNALEEYFLAHLNVCQVAGKLQGLLPGDLGNLGNSSLTMRQISSLLELLVGQTLKDDETRDWTENPAQQLRLEVTARLLACAQRLHFSGAAWDQWNGASFAEQLQSVVENEVDPDEDLPVVRGESQEESFPVEVVSEAPFTQYVLRNLYPVLPSTIEQGADGERLSGGDNRTKALLEALFSSSEGNPPKSRLVTAALRVTTACAVFFPCGDCWSSSLLGNWYPVPAVDERANVRTSSKRDLALVIDIVCDVLERCGGATGDDDVQRSVSLCLRGLATASGAILLLSREATNGRTEVQKSWRRVWHTLFRSDLRFRAMTKVANSGSKGELVLQLLSEMIRRCCLDTELLSAESSSISNADFVRKHQTDVWNLPVFSGTVPGPHSAFILLHAVLTSGGLVQDSTREGIESEEGSGMRLRLLSYCSRSFHQDDIDTTTPVVSTCIVSLLRGQSFCLPASFHHGPVVPVRLSHVQDDRKSGLSPVFRHDSDLFSTLWSVPSFEDAVELVVLEGDLVTDPTRESCSLVYQMLLHQEKSAKSSDFISDAESKILLDFIKNKCLGRPSNNGTSEEGVESMLPTVSTTPFADLKRLVRSAKIRLALVLPFGKVLTCMEKQEISEEASQIFKELSSNARLLCNDPDALQYVCGHALGIIRALAMLGSQKRVDWPQELFDAATTLYDTFSDLLKTSSFFGNNVTSPSPRKQAPAREDLFDDLDIDSDAASGSSQNHHTSFNDTTVSRKRKRNAKEGALNLNKRPATACLAIDLHSQLLIASLLIALSPSSDTCKTLAEEIAGVEIDSSSGECGSSDTNAFAAAAVATMLCSREALLFGIVAKRLSDCGGESQLGVSPVLSLCRIITGVRSVASPDSDLHLFGFHLCQQLVRIRDGDLLEESQLNTAEANELVELIRDTRDNNERRSLFLRPSLRDIQLKSAVQVFRVGKLAVHDLFDRDYARTLVIPGICDINGRVRRRAAKAVGVAIRILPEKKVIDSIHKRLPALFAPSREEESYRSWYENRSLGASEGFQSLEDQVWEDALDSVRHGVLACWSEIAGATLTTNVLHLYLFNLARAASGNAKMEGLCFLCIERIAILRGGYNAASLLRHFTADLIAAWLETGDKLLDLPLFLTAPSFVHRLLQAGHLAAFLCDTDDSNFDEFKKHAAAEFVSRHSHVLLPSIIRNFVSRLSGAGTTGDRRRQFMGNEPYLRELCSVFEDHYDDDVVRGILTKHVPDTIALAAWLQSGTEEEKHCGVEMIKLVSGILGEDAICRKSELRGGRAVRRLTELCSVSSEENVNERFLAAIATISGVFSKSSESAGANLTLIEGLVFSRLLLDRQFQAVSPCQVWRPMGCVLAHFAEEIKRGAVKASQLMFVFHLLSNILVDEEMSGLHSQVVNSLKCLVTQLVESEPKSTDAVATSGVFTQVLHTVFHVFLQNQKFFLRDCELSKQTWDESLLLCLGLVGWHRKAQEDNSWGWNTLAGQKAEISTIYEHRKAVPSSTDELLKVAFALLEYLVHAYKVLGITAAEMVSIYSANGFGEIRDRQFEKLHPSYAFHVTMDAFISASSPPEKEETLVMLPLAATIDTLPRLALRSSSNPVLRLGKGKETCSIDERRVVDELHQIEAALHHGSRTFSQDSRCIQLQLAENLKLLCTASFPHKVRLAATRCLGEVDLSYSTNASQHQIPHEYENWLCAAVESGNLLRCLQSRCVEALVTAMKSPHAKIAMVALDTLKALLSTRIGVECTEHIDDEEILSLVSPFLRQKRKAQSMQLLFSRQEADRIRSRNSKQQSSQWCWDERLWERGPVSESFEEWICSLVSSLLLCCFGESSDNGSESVSSKDFFKLCQRMSYLDPAFAACLFPALILDLLQDSTDDREEIIVDGVLADTWVGTPSTVANQKLSNCFSILLKSSLQCIKQGDFRGRRCLGVAIDALDILCQFTVFKFRTSRSHRQNPVLAKASGKKGTRKSSKSSPTKDCHLQKSEGTRWDGLRFGVVLRLNGNLVSNACLQAGRFKSALFYAELYADSRFGRSTALGEFVSTASLSAGGTSMDIGTGDISGFGRSCSSDQNATEYSNNLMRDRAEFWKNLRECYSLAEELASRDAADRFIADLYAISPEYNDSQLFEHGQLTEPLPYLEMIDCTAQSGFRLSESVSTVANTLDNLGLRFTLGSYISGIANHHSHLLGEIEQTELAEKWSECHLFKLLWAWEDGVFGDGVKPLQPGLDHHSSSNEGGAIFKENNHGFHALMLETMVSMKNSDYSACLDHSRLARDKLLDTFSSHLSDDVLGEKFSSIIDKCRALNVVEQFAINKKLPSTEVFGGNEHAPRSLSDCIEEICTRHRYEKAKQSSELTASDNLMAYFTRLWQSYLRACSFSDRNTAAQVLQRIHRSLQTEKNQLGPIFAKTTMIKLRLEEAKLLELNGNFTGAIRNVKLITEQLRSNYEQLPSEEKALLSDALVQGGRWMAKHKVEPANYILKHYLEPGKDLAMESLKSERTSENTNRASSSLLSMSDVAFTIFETVSNRISSLEWLQAGKSLEERKRELAASEELLRQTKTAKPVKGKKSMKKSFKDPRELALYNHKLKKEVDQVERERTEIQQSVSAHQDMVLRTIVNALTLTGMGNSHTFSNYVYRLIGVWFAAAENGNTVSIDGIIDDAVENVPSFRFVALASQLFSRVEKISDTSAGTYQGSLHKIIVKICLDHPYHCLVHLVGLLNGTNVGSGRGASTFIQNAGVEKVEVAEGLIQVLQRNDPSFVGNLIESYRTLAHAYIHLAMAPTTELPKGAAKKIPLTTVCKKKPDRLDACLGTRSQSLSCPPCIFTKPPMVRPGCDYGEGVEDPVGSERVSSFESTFAITDGGVHRPKIVMCIGSKGGKYRQLVKGEDEIRQDAVMQQVFSYVNDLMRIRSKKRDSSYRGQLNLFTYNIIPLSPQSGVLEWVEDSAPFGDFIYEKKGVSSPASHSRYFPGEWSNTQCKARLDGAKKPEEKRAAFDEVCAKFSPSFRFFFIEQFGFSMDRWFDAKIRYTRSVAVNSVVGHILGIGDRHTSNILIHQGTGEVIHIDFGIVFEQGKLLTVPETVPFRLTRNIVDGMGPTGTEGLFTNAAEATMGVLRDNTKALLTILSAIACDPLYAWSLSPIKAQQRQQEGGEDCTNAYDDEQGNGDRNQTERNEAASRAIAKVHEKLQGYEDGTSGEQQSIEGQIQLLVNSATDRDNLCKLFVGWGPWI